MKENDLPFDRGQHAVYTKNAKKCVQDLLRRCYDEKEAAEVLEKQNCSNHTFLLPVRSPLVLLPDRQTGRSKESPKL